MATTTDLVIQAEDIATPQVKALHTISQAGDIRRIDHIGHQAFRLSSANFAARDEVAAYCENAALDFAFVPAAQRLSDFGLLSMDMDSTLITIECIDEIADFAGCKADVAAITASAMRGEIDWPESLRQRVRLLAGLDESVLQQVYETRLRLSAGADELLAASRKAGLKTLLVSGGFTFFTARLKSRLKLDFAYSNELAIENGKLTGQVLGPLCDAEGKARHLRETAAALGIPAERCLAIGDGANDLKMMAAAGMSIAYHAKPIVRAQATAAINHVGLDGVPALFN
ncbi:MAG: phosphoserine phosphatase SerB [Betaproteobacteria bacterium]